MDKNRKTDFLSPSFPPVRSVGNAKADPSVLDDKVPAPFPDGNVPTLTHDLDENIDIFKSVFKDDEGLIIRRVSTSGGKPIRCAVIFLESMTNDEAVSASVIRSLVACRCDAELFGDEILRTAAKNIIFASDMAAEKDMTKIVNALLAGNSVILAHGCSSVLSADTKGYEKRSIKEPEGEKLLRGPRDGFTENISTNVSLVRRRLSTVDLKLKFFTFGTTTNTKVAVMYLDSMTDKNILNELYRRLERINFKGGFDSSFLEDYIKDTPSAPFRTVGVTERPDTVAGKLLEGRIAIIVNGSPSVLTVPYLFDENFVSNEDYYLNFYFSNFGRFLRIISFFGSICIPAVFVALLTFHQQMMPTSLTISILEARDGVPLPVIIECLAMLFVFQILRETAMRMPSAISQTLSIVGSLVIGDAAVSAKFVSAPMIIIVAVTSMMSLMNPRLKSVQIVYRIALILLAGVLGLYGVILGLMFMTVQLLAIRSFGVPYVRLISDKEPFNPFKFIVKGPWRTAEDGKAVRIPAEVRPGYYQNNSAENVRME